MRDEKLRRQHWFERPRRIICYCGCLWRKVGTGGVCCRGISGTRQESEAGTKLSVSKFVCVKVCLGRGWHPAWLHPYLSLLKESVQTKRLSAAADSAAFSLCVFQQ